MYLSELKGIETMAWLNNQSHLWNILSVPNHNKLGRFCQTEVGRTEAESPSWDWVIEKGSLRAEKTLREKKRSMKREENKVKHIRIQQVFLSVTSRLVKGWNLPNFEGNFFTWYPPANWIC